MTIKTDHGNFNVSPITFKGRRALHKVEVQALDTNGTVNTSKFYNVLEWIQDFAFENPEKALGKLDDNAIDEVLMAIYNRYKEPNVKK
tara:strand:+ start:120 stop:383 length:264 start_codon:yes stop_codon:yes gene_type:complete